MASIILLKYSLNITAASAIGALADAICQAIERSVAKEAEPGTDFVKGTVVEHDYKRTARFALSFGCVGGTNSFVWYQYVLPWLSQHDFWKMMVWDNLVYNTYFIVVGLAANEALKPRGKEDPSICQEVARNFPATWITAEIIMLPADVVMFTVISRDYRVVFIKSVDVFWMVGASYFANRKPTTQHKQLSDSDDDDSKPLTTTTTTDS
eukprot:TRINITY_DN12766_c0_g1_i1.p1 TRINITY_DN12766_c0_g1~~TRINITY_DN12766_c0_g1_i1.p1  ORF type:complete len:209 (+),score=30.83 TRINITY_DN12766_c0_g1_i1:148-774(+)